MNMIFREYRDRIGGLLLLPPNAIRLSATCVMRKNWITTLTKIYLHKASMGEPTSEILIFKISFKEVDWSSVMF